MRFLFIIILTLSCFIAHAQQEKAIHSPDGSIKVLIRGGQELSYTISLGGVTLIDWSIIDIRLQDGRQIKGKVSLRKSRNRHVNDIIISPVPEKRRMIPDVYNELQVELSKSFILLFRVYDDGVAYRLLSNDRDSIVVKDEAAEFNLAGTPTVYYSKVVKREQADIFHTSFEEPYQVHRVDSMESEALIFTPLLASWADGTKMVITESDLEDYPGMFLQRMEGKSVLKAVFAGYPLEERIAEGEFPQAIVTKRAEYIARTTGRRSFPWRVMMISTEDKQLPANDLVYRLASPSRVKDPSWIKPGKGTDEWIIGINLFNVPFRSGVNTATYKYYIDFAKRFGFERIMMDAGWSDYKDLTRINPNIDMDEIAAYAREKGISLSMWTLAMTLEKQLDTALRQFNKWGVDFIMTDFMDRDDQEMVKFYHRIAEACARHRIMVMYHGAFKPAGFNRTYPNAVTREGVLGSEYNIWSDKATPEHNLLLPFIRMTSGPMDYEPGILDNATARTFRPIGDKVMAMGTRLHQAAMFIVYESPIQLFSGNPSQGLLEPEFMELVGSIPTTWDTTIVIDGKVGDYILTARRKGEEWFIGGMTDWTPRELTIPLGFTGAKKYKAVICEDGINADRYPSDYVLRTTEFLPGETFQAKMAPGGGFIIRLTPIE